MNVDVVLIHYPTLTDAAPYSTDVLGVYRCDENGHSGAWQAGHDWKADKPDTCWWVIIGTHLKETA